MIEIRDLNKNYGEVQALRGISGSIGQGQVVGLLGPNGAGKTTAMKILVGYLLPDAGTATVAGHDVVEEPLAVQQRVGYLPENAPLYTDMLVQEYLQFIADVRGLEPAAAMRSIRKAVDECSLGDVLARPIDQLSKGYRQRVGLAAAILHEPPILILDEPTNGLDPNQIVEVRDLIRRMGETKTVILSTHILPEVEATCDRAMILIDGRIRADGTLEDLTRSSSQIVTLAGAPTETARAALIDLPGVGTVDLESETDGRTTWRLGRRAGADLGETVFRTVRDRDWTLTELRRDDKTLEQVFRELTERDAGVAA
jgi:ABC-2 type transport system ATP-binding protein